MTPAAHGTHVVSTRRALSQGLVRFATTDYVSDHSSRSIRNRCGAGTHART